MAIKVEHTFVVPAPVERAFGTLTDLARVVPCIPGTELTELLGTDRFRAAAKLRVGPVELRFTGVGEILARDEVKRSASVRARGSDAKGRGSFLTEMRFAVTPLGKDQSRVRVETDLTLIGAVAQFGRGAEIVGEISQQLARDFATALAALIEAERIVQAVAARAASTPVLAPRAVETVGGAPRMAAPNTSAARASKTLPAFAARSVHSVDAPAKASPPISLVHAFWNAIRAILRRWFGARP